VESGPAGDGETGGLSIENSWDILSRALAKSAKPTTFPASLFPFRTVSEYYGGHFEILRDLEAHVGLPQLLPIEKVDEKSLSSVGPTGHVKDSYLSYSCVVEGYVERSVIFPHVRIGKNAKVIGSVVLDYNSIGTGAVVHNTILCDNGELFARMTPNVGEGARVGGEDETGENTLFPRFINGGVTLIGRNVEIPRGIEVSSNCYIASETGKAAFKGRERVRASETILES
jgi:NDP-sugar pyrophosphorylase family protein